MKGSFKRKWLYTLILMFSLPVVTVTAQKKQVKVTYKPLVNGEIKDYNRTDVVISESDAAKSYTVSNQQLIPQTPEEVSYIDFIKKKTYQVADLYDGKRIYNEREFSNYPELVQTEESEKIEGYLCKKIKTTLRSNSIEIWYTDELGVKGTPIMGYGIVDGLVLKVVRNGNYGVIATEIEKIKRRDIVPVIPENLGERVDMPFYKHLVTSSFITDIEIFKDEQISWGAEIKNPKGIVADKTYRFAGGTIILKRVKLPKVGLDYQVFAEIEQYSNGDAYDRTGTVFVIPEDKEQSFFNALYDLKSVPAFNAANGKSYPATIATPEFSPAVELVRFFTPFGVRHYNDEVKVFGQEWENKAFYKQEITELLPLLKEEVWIGVFIGNYDKGGHKVSLNLKYYPGSPVVSKEDSSDKNWMIPLFNTLNIMEMAGQEYSTMFKNDSLKIEFEIPENIKNVTLRYISTGHGGWGGGDEFNQKVNEIFVDGKLVDIYIPWNCDCGSFRKYNPASGNFWNGVSSSDYSRSGWCPGKATNPVFIPLKNIKAGKHVMKIAIPIGENEGNSFSSWNISGVLMGEKM